MKDQDGTSVFVFAVYDSKTDAFMNPFVMTSAPQALRSFTKAALDEEHDFHLYGGDYTLFELGGWDPQKGVVWMHEHRINHGTALQARSSYEQMLAASQNPPLPMAVQGGE